MCHDLSWLGVSLSCTGETPVLHAARQGHTGTAKYLLEHGADPSIPSELGATALHHAAGIGKSLFFVSSLAYLVVSESFPLVSSS